MAKSHQYEIRVAWTGNEGEGTSTYRSYRRDHVITGKDKEAIAGSADPAFRGDPTRYNPEELLVAALSSCHMLSYLHLCAVNGLVVESYEDEASGTMVEEPSGAGRLTAVMLRPRVGFSGKFNLEKAEDLHEEAHRLCFIANSVNFPVTCRPRS